MTRTSNDNRINILALGRLYDFASNKRFHLEANKFLDDQIGLKALELNNEIKTKTGIDVFAAKNDEDLVIYLNTLNNFTTGLSNDILRPDEMSYESELNKLQSEFPIEKIKTFNITVSKEIKEVIKKHFLIIPDVIYLSKNPDAVIYIDKFGCFLATKKSKIKNKEKLILFVLQFYNPNHIIPIANDTSEGMFTKFMKLDEAKDLKVNCIFFFDFNEYKMYSLNPVRLFIKSLDIWGLNIELNSRISKFHVDVFMPPHLKSLDEVQGYVDSLNISGLSSRNLLKQVVITKTRFGFMLRYLYCIDLYKQLNYD